MFLNWFKRKPKKISDRGSESLITSHYLFEKEKQKTALLTEHLQREWVSPEVEQCRARLKELVGSDDLEKIRKDYEKGRFDTHPEKETIGRLARYVPLVKGFSEEMAAGVKGESLLGLFEGCRHSRLLAYHLFQFVDSLERELSVCMKAQLQQIIQALPEGLTHAQKKELLEKAELGPFLKEISLACAIIMEKEMRQAVTQMEKVLVDPTCQVDPIAFELEVGQEAVNRKIERLQELNSSLDLPHLKKQLLEAAFL